MFRTVLFASLTLFAVHAPGQDYWINSSGDRPRSDTAAPGVCDTGFNIVGPGDPPVAHVECTLRALIETVNDAGGPLAEVAFRDWIPTIGVGVVLIMPNGDPLPPLMAPIHLNARTHPSPVYLSGSNIDDPDPDADHGLLLGAGASGSIIEGMTIIHFPGVGVFINADEVQLLASQVGVNHVNAVTPNLSGVIINGSDNLIGHTPWDPPTDRNTISGNEEFGVYIFGGSGNIVAGNHIGVNTFGDQARGNGLAGIVVTNNAGATQIGWHDPADPTQRASNVVAGHTTTEIGLSQDNTVSCTHVGVNADGDAVLEAASSGISVVNQQGQAGGNVIGDADCPNVIFGQDIGVLLGLPDFSAGDGNEVRFNYIGVGPGGGLGQGSVVGIHDFNSDNTRILGNVIGHVTVGAGCEQSAPDMELAGNHIGLMPDGSPVPVAAGVVVGCSGASVGEAGNPNVIGFAEEIGIALAGFSTNATVADNWVGVTPDDQAAPLGVSSIGIFVHGETHEIGVGNRGNVIGNAAIGIGVPVNSNGGHMIHSNRVGLSPDGSSHPLSEAGIYIAAHGNGIGSNFVGNSEFGLVLEGNDNDVTRNAIGVGPGQEDIGNLDAGILLGGQNNTIGGASSVEGNLTVYNQGAGIEVITPYHNIYNNRIGVLGNGTPAGNGGDGILFSGDAWNEMAMAGEAGRGQPFTLNIGNGPGTGNTISGNSGSGIRVEAPHARISHNTIGLTPQGNALGNSAAGVFVAADVHDTLVEHNGIAYNSHGVAFAFSPDAGVRNRITATEVWANDRAGIVLGPHGRDQDPDDADTGPNNLQNFPEFQPRSGYNPDSGMVEVELRVDSHPDNSPYPLIIEVFLADAESDHPQGMVYIGQAQYDDPQQWASLSIEPPAGLELVEFDLMTATATTTDGNTSAFSDLFGQAPELSVGGTVHGLGGDITLTNLPFADSMTVSGQGTVPFTFPAKLFPGESYQVVIASQPAGQSCTLENGSGSVDDEDVSDIAASCVTNEDAIFRDRFE